MKIFRRKKSGREVGTFYVRPKGGGRPISLALNGVPCTNAVEGNRRAKLALKGKWPPAAVGAARAAAAAEHVPEDDDLTPGDSPKGGSGVGAPAAVPSPAPPSAPSPSPEESDGGATGGEPDPLAAAAAAAGDAVGPSPDVAGSPDDDEQRRRSEWGQAFASHFGGATFGADASGFTPGMACASAHWSLVSTICARIGRAKKPPQYLVVDPQSIKVPMQMLASAWDEQLRRWGLDLSKVEPWMAMLGGTIGLVVACSASMTTTPPQPEGAPAGGA
jgi:hypothetical protein